MSREFMVYRVSSAISKRALRRMGLRGTTWKVYEIRSRTGLRFRFAWNTIGGQMVSTVSRVVSFIPVTTSMISP